MTGTAIFMATALLQTQKDNKTITHTWEHDIESLAYMLLYSIYKHAMDTSAMDKKGFQEEFQAFFGAPTVKELVNERFNIFRQAEENGIRFLLEYINTDDSDTILSSVVSGTFRFLADLHTNLQASELSGRKSPNRDVDKLYPRRPPQPLPFEDMYKCWYDVIRVFQSRA
ncbi:hypothetical protein L226DRAFT_531383 [Lentinus tigrinus ALCF2SS1-7]|uniref:Fungal-type protein kinase domain-containing protein n=1 Tax=Lentinus tigrinus ALCF2SS1-6 TaxID=1328759 RepID=A0A5C2RNT0_9APHY|nr:hypothetical protein L227DRAFT_582190 [Lentinus tigrinus ALCF2SS1-6]RPD52117.1 hypothetical protein L227DRAFT_582188 [Lentinus tigrinus ALCF2SS1-6]RPD79622.1 hypothetical protein L226DRAFT_531383 [Lentinus tigrinus ALCF2SS1-7]